MSKSFNPYVGFKTENEAAALLELCERIGVAGCHIKKVGEEYLVIGVTKEIYDTVKAAKPGQLKDVIRINLPMAFKKETPGTYVYECDDPESPITTLYVKKFGLPHGAPKTISVIVLGETK